MSNFRALFEPDRLFIISIVLVVVYLTVIPLAVIVLGSFQKGLPGTWTPVTLDNYVRAFSQPSLYLAIANAVTYSVGAGLVSFTLGTLLAWLTERTDLPLKGLVYGSVLGAMMIPGVLFTISWILLLAPKAGLIQRLAHERFRSRRAALQPLQHVGHDFRFRHRRFLHPVSLHGSGFSLDGSGVGGSLGQRRRGKPENVFHHHPAPDGAGRPRRLAADFHPRHRGF
jgi:hypothetical protein